MEHQQIARKCFKIKRFRAFCFAFAKFFSARFGLICFRLLANYSRLFQAKGTGFSACPFFCFYAGRIINATPDGRLRGEPLFDAASPTYGRDTRGATAAINSVSKPDYAKVACGSVVNQKFSPSMFGFEKRKKLMALIKTYFKKGGQEVHINATSREILLDAMEHPENYQSLVVRVSGFSAFYVTLDRAVPLDILNRTQQE